MLATLREYGRERLAGTEEWDSLGKLHAEYFLALAEHFVPELQDADQRHARDDLDLEHDNLRAAMDWAVVNRNREIAGRLALALQWFWYWGGHVQEGHDSMSRVLEVLSDDRDGLRGYVSMGAGILADVHGELETANARLGLALELGRELDDPALVARALAALGVVAKDHGQLAEAAARFEESIEAQQSLGGDIDIETTVRLGEVCYLRGDHAAARRHLESAYSAAQRLGRTGEMAWAARHIGELMRRQGLTGEARRKLQEAVETYRTIDYPPGLAWSRLCLGILEKEGGRADRAAEIVDLALDGFRAVGDQRGIPYALLELAELARERGDLDEAHRGVTEANDVAGTIGDLRAVAWSNWETAMIARARGRPDYQRLRIALDQFQEVGDRSGAHAACDSPGALWPMAATWTAAPCFSEPQRQSPALRKASASPLKPLGQPPLKPASTATLDGKKGSSSTLTLRWTSRSQR